jgi:hypothetical protein
VRHELRINKSLVGNVPINLCQTRCIDISLNGVVYVSGIESLDARRVPYRKIPVSILPSARRDGDITCELDAASGHSNHVRNGSKNRLTLTVHKVSKQVGTLSMRP